MVESDARARRDTARAAEIAAAAEAELLALERRVRDGRLKDPAKIGRAAQRILGSGGAGRLFDVEIGPGRFIYHYNEDALAYEELLAGRYVLTTSLTPAQASTAQVVAAYRQLAGVEARFRALKDFLHLRPVRHWTEKRVRGHVAVCVYAAVIETLIGQALAQADIRDPDLTDQLWTPSRSVLLGCDRRSALLGASALAISMLSAVPSAKHTRFLASDSSMAASDFRRLGDERRDTQGGAHSGCG